MELQPLMEKAAAATVAVAHEVKPDQFTAQTPCTEWDVRALANHLTYWSAFLSEPAARKQIALDDSIDDSTDFTGNDWPEQFAAKVHQAVAAWAEPGAWDGTTWYAGNEMPARMTGTMLIAELLTHGWDLAKATGQELACDDDVASVALSFTTEMAPGGRKMGYYAAEVPVDTSASPLQQVIAASGRDPNWTPVTVT